MAISSCLKTQINNKDALVTSFHTNMFDIAVNVVAGSSVGDLIAFTHLSNFFGNFSEWLYVTPTISFLGSVPNTMMGGVADSEMLTGHPVDSLSFVGFTKQTLKDAIASEVPRSDSGAVMGGLEWRTLINKTDFADLNKVIEANSPNGAMITVVDAKTTLKIMRCTQSDIDGLGRHSDYPDYVDAFDIVKAKLVNNVELLNNTGLAPAVYHADGDYIEFIADCAVQAPTREPELNPVPIPT